MKLIFTLLLVTTFCIGFTFTSCGAGGDNQKAVATAMMFYRNIQQKNYASAISLCSKKAFETDTKEAWITSLQKNAILLGDVKSFTKTSGFNIAMSTAVGTTVTVAYDVQWQYGKSKDSITLIQEKDGSMKVYNYRWDHINPIYIQETDASAGEARQYLDAIKNGNYEAALNLCSADALKITSRKDWQSFLSNADNKLGTLSGYQIVRDSCFYNIGAKGESGPGNYYDIYVQTKRGKSSIIEKITFYQKNYTDRVKLVGHNFM